MLPKERVLAAFKHRTAGRGINAIDVRGKLVHECAIPGETRADDVFPGHPNGLPVSRDRWLLVYATRGWRGVDDDRSIVYQLRKDMPDGPVLKEGLIQPTSSDWEPLGDGAKFARNQGHPVGFGVPRGALIEGKPAPNANVFAIAWRVSARELAGGQLGKARAARSGRTQQVEWMQCRLNDAGDDIEVLRPPGELRQKGFEDAPHLCSLENVEWMNQAFTSPVPFNAAATEWVGVNHVNAAVGPEATQAAGGRGVPLKFRFDEASGLYEWVETGLDMQAATQPCSEASIAPVDGSWLICARSNGAIGWVRTEDPFTSMPPAVFTTYPAINAPVTMFRCADGVIRILTGDVGTSPYGHGRCPLYCWDVSPTTFEATNPQVVFDPIAAGVLPRETGPRAEMAKVLPHLGGRRQTVVWRVRTKNVGHQYGSLPPVTEEWKQKHGLYYAEIEYGRECPPAWEFEPAPAADSRRELPGAPTET